jgi:hypothetical protein
MSENRGDKAVLRARALTLDAELDRARKLVSRGSDDRVLGKSAADRFVTLIEQTLRTRITEFRDGLATAAVCDAWRDFEKLRHRCDKVVRECSAFLHGVTARTAGLDKLAGSDIGLCLLADSVVRDLSKRAQVDWWGLTIPGDEEFVQEMAHVIRIRWADVSLWNLPIVAHEFGHLVAPRLKALDSDREPFREFLDRRTKSEHEKLNEYFADLFAVHTLGASFACSCLLLRFDPVTAFEEGKSHPPEANRARFLLAALEDQAAPSFSSAGSKEFVALLERAWSNCLQEAGYDPEADRKADTQARSLYVEMKPLLAALQSKLAYDGWLRAQALYHQWKGSGERQALGTDVTRADVLNAAWLWRVSAWSANSDGSDNRFELKEIGETAAAALGGIS